MNNQSDPICRRSQLNLIWITIELNVAAKLAAPPIIEFLIDEKTLVKQVRVAACRSYDCARLSQGTADGHNCYIRIAEDVLARPQINTSYFQTVSFERDHVLFIEAVEADVVIK